MEHDYVVRTPRNKIGLKQKVIDRLVDKMKWEIMAEEDARIFEALDSIAKSGNNDI